MHCWVDPSRRDSSNRSTSGTKVNENFTRSQLTWLYRYIIEHRSQLITNRKSCVGFRLVKKSMTLSDLQRKKTHVLRVQRSAPISFTKLLILVLRHWQSKHYVVMLSLQLPHLGPLSQSLIFPGPHHWWCIISVGCIASDPNDEFSAFAEAEKMARDVTLDADLTSEPNRLHTQSGYM